MDDVTWSGSLQSQQPKLSLWEVDPISRRHFEKEFELRGLLWLQAKRKIKERLRLRL